MSDGKESIQYQGIETIGSKLLESSEKLDTYLKAISQKMKYIFEEEIMVGDSAKAIYEQFQELEGYFPSYVKEIQNYSKMMVDTVASYQESDEKISNVTKEIDTLDNVGEIGKD
ncbi:MAG TPA: hypothetical protein IAB56_02950 [Candidatus Scybalousia intestinigallinarum]|nr:hypothetical protein [Candidatus Scybalousia intestinigallinarum]